MTNLIGFLSIQCIDVFLFVYLCNGTVGIFFKDGGLEFLNGLSLILSYLLYQLLLLFKDVNHEVFTTFDVAVQHISNLVKVHRAAEGMHLFPTALAARV